MTKARALILALLVLVSAVAVAAPASAAGATGVSVTPAEETIGVGETTTFEVVVENSQGGVGAFSGEILLGNGDAAEIVSAEVLGHPDFQNITVKGDEVSMVAAGMNTGDSGTVTVATVTVKGSAGGDTAVNLRINAVGDESGGSYTISGVNDGLLHVSGQTVSSSVSLSPQSQTIQVDQTKTIDIVVDDADNGVGAYEATLTLSNPGVGDIHGVHWGGQAEFKDVQFGENRDSIHLRAAGMDTANDGEVTIAEVEITGINSGSSAVNLDVAALGNENAAPYQVTDVGNGSLTVESGGGAGGEKVSVYLDGAPNGLQQYSINITSDDGTAITEVSPELIGGNQFQSFGVGTPDVKARGVDLTDEIGSFNEQRTLFTATFDGAVSEDNVSITVNELLDDSENAIDPARVGISIRGANPFNGNPIPGVGGEPPRDPDGDGLFEDINGDGTVNFQDAVSLAFARANELTPQQAAALDFNGDGQFTFDDAVTLAFKI